MYKGGDTKNNTRRSEMTKIEKIIVSAWAITVLYVLIQVMFYMGQMADSLDKIAGKYFG